MDELRITVVVVPSPKPATEYEIRTTFTNEGTSRLAFSTARYCPTHLRAFSTPARVGPPLWDEAIGAACPLVSARIALASGGMQVLKTRLMRSQIPLPAGTYYPDATVVVDDSVRVVGAGALML